MMTQYERYTITDVTCDSAWPLSTSYGVSLWKSMHAGKSYVTFGQSVQPYLGLYRGFHDGWLHGYQSQWLIQSGQAVPNITNTVYRKEKVGDRKRFVASKKNGDIIFHPYYIVSGSIISRPGYQRVATHGSPITLRGVMGRDGNFYYDSQTAQSRTGGWFSIAVTWIHETVERVHPFDPSTLPWFPQDLKMVEPNYTIDSGLVTSTLADANSGELDLLTEALELPETIKYLIQLLDAGGKVTLRHQKKVQKLTRSAIAAKAAGKVFKLTDALASAWLQYRYALMPILYSIEDVRSALKTYNRVFAKFKNKTSKELDLGFNASGWKVKSNIEVVERCIIKRSYDPQTLIDKLLNILKLNPLATAWELTTLSFVVDWFVNIGDIIDALTGYDDSLQSTACYSWKTTGAATLTHELTGASITLNIDCYKRELIQPLAEIGLSWDSHLTWKQQIDAVALSWGPISQRIQALMKKGVKPHASS